VLGALRPDPREGHRPVAGIRTRPIPPGAGNVHGRSPLRRDQGDTP
jgi:hypothetical protein